MDTENGKKVFGDPEARMMLGKVDAISPYTHWRFSIFVKVQDSSTLMKEDKVLVFNKNKPQGLDEHQSGQYLRRKINGTSLMISELVVTNKLKISGLSDVFRPLQLGEEIGDRELLLVKSNDSTASFYSGAFVTQNLNTFCKSSLFKVFVTCGNYWEVVSNTEVVIVSARLITIIIRNSPSSISMVTEKI